LSCINLINIVDPTEPTLNTSSLINCGVKSTTLSIASGALNSAANWQWYKDSCGGIYIGSGPSVTFYPSTTTTYYARGEGGCVSPGPCGSITVTVNPRPAILITNSLTFACYPSAVDLTSPAITAGSTPGLTYRYTTEYSFNPTTELASPNAVDIPGTYYIIGTTAANCSSIGTAEVRIYPKPTLVTTNPAAVCSPAVVNLTGGAITAGSTVGLAYTYFTDAAATTPLTSPNSVALSGSYYIVGRTGFSCTDTSGVNVTVNPKPTVTIPAFSSVCANAGPFVLTGGLPIGGVYTGLGVSGGNFRPSTAGVGTHAITYSYTDANLCQSSSSADLTVSPAIDNTVNNSGSTLTANSPVGTYQWINCGNSNTEIPGATGQNFTPSNDGNYAVIVTVNVCSDTSDCNNISISGLANYAQAPGLSVFPNPNHGDFNISFPKEETFILINDLGQTLQTISLTQSNNMSANVSGLKSGIYFLLSNSNSLLKFKIVVGE
jgi:hypothetical protein